MIRSFAWVLVFFAWFWIDGSMFDSAILKNLLLPVSLGLVLLTSDSRWKPNLGAWLFLAFLSWSVWRMGAIAPPAEIGTMLGLAALAFLAGNSRLRPPVWIAIAALLVAVVKGLDDLVFLRNLGGGIPLTPTSFFVHRNLFALVLAPSLILLAGWLVAVARRGPARWIGWSVFALGAFVFVLADCRGAVLGAGVAAAFLLLRGLLRTTSLQAKILGALSLIVVLTTGALMHQDRLSQTKSEILAIVAGDPITTDVATNFRPWVWLGALRIWKENPLSGIGVGDFRYEIESALDPWLDVYRLRRLKVDVAHSHWLQTLTERGVVGLSLELGLWVTAMIVSARRGAPFLASALLCMGVHGLVGEGLEYGQGFVLWWFLIGAALASPISRDRGIRVRWIAAIGLAALAVPLHTFALSIHGDQRLHRMKAVGKPLEIGDLESAWRDSPRSPTILQEIGTLQAKAGAILEARSTLEHRRALYPVAGAIGGEELLAGIWRSTGALDSAANLLDEAIRLYPTDPWLLKELLRLRRVTEGCEGARKLLTSARPRMDSVFFSNSARASIAVEPWRTWLVLDRAGVASIASRERQAFEFEEGKARLEWSRLRGFCKEDRP